MSGLNKLGSALTTVFVVSLVVLLAQLFYVLWRRRVFRRNSPAVHGGDVPDFSADSYSTTFSKELLYFLCWKHQTRLEQSGAPVRNPDGSSRVVPPEVMDAFKFQGIYGSSRVLFTIKEEEREDVESEKSLSSAADKGPMKTKRVCLEEYLQVDAGNTPEVAITVDGDHDTTPLSTFDGDHGRKAFSNDTTPFSTPCASPAYYTPVASPTREVGVESK